MATLQKSVVSVATGQRQLVDMTPEEQAKLEAFWAECAEIEKNRKTPAMQMVERILADPKAVAQLKAALQ